MKGILIACLIAFGPFCGPAILPDDLDTRPYMGESFFPKKKNK